MEYKSDELRRHEENLRNEFRAERLVHTDDASVHGLPGYLNSFRSYLQHRRNDRNGNDPVPIDVYDELLRRERPIKSRPLSPSETFALEEDTIAQYFAAQGRKI